MSSHQSALTIDRPGAVERPYDPGYDAARSAWNLAVDQRPAAVAHPRDAAEVAAVVRAAAAAGLRVAPQATGHNANPLGPLEDVVLLRTAGLDEVTIDPAARRARVGAGVLWQEVVAAAAPAGLAALHGSSPDVGVVGYSLGGGVGWYARALGLQAGSLTAVELVLADGSLVRADADHEPELFWALRGGGGSVGVVTAVEFDLHPITSAYAGALVWDWRDAHRVLSCWAPWAAGAPDEVTTSFRILRLPPIEAVPAPLRGRQVVMVDGAVLADDATAARILAPLRDLGPELDTFTRMPAPALTRLHGDPETPTPAVSGSAVLGPLPAGAIDAIVAAAGPDSGSSLLMAELRQLGGALGRPDPRGGALDRIDGSYLLYAGAIAADPDMARRGTADADRLVDAVRPWSTGGQYLNFAERPVDPADAFPAGTYQRLRALRTAVDPDGRFLANHPIPAAR
jgi:FAD/FMN-containing dehydrogenase